MGELIQATCQRCGFEWRFDQVYLRRNYDPTLCASCKAKPREKVNYGNDYCTPWLGDFDLEDRPMKDGELWRPGERTCKHSDCVRPTHIIPLPGHTTRRRSGVRAA